MAQDARADDTFALVWQDASLHTRASKRAKTVTVRPGAARNLGAVVPYAVVGRKNGFIRVRSTS